MLALFQQLDQYRGMLDAIQKRTDQWGQGVAATHKTTAYKLHQAWAQIQLDLIKLGDSLTPLLSKWLPILVKLVTWVTNAFRGLSPFLRSAFGYLAAGAVVFGRSSWASRS